MLESTGELPGQRGFGRLSELNPALAWEQLPPALLGAPGSPAWAGGCAGSSERDGGAVWLCKLPRSMDHRCHLPVTNIPETLLSPASPAGPSPRCWAVILECSGASLSSQRTAQGGCCGCGRQLGPGPQPSPGQRSSALHHDSPRCALNFDFFSVQEE